MNFAVVMASMFVRLFIVPAPVLVFIATTTEPNNIQEEVETPVKEEILSEDVALTFLFPTNYPIEPSATPTLLPTPLPTDVPTPVPTRPPMVVPTKAPTPRPVTTLVPNVSLFDLVNQWRRDTGRPVFVESAIACSVAAERLPMVMRQFSHEGFTAMMPTLFAQYPNLNKISENLANVPNAQAALSGWLKSPGHRKNLEQDIPYMCIKSKGRIYVQIFTDA